MTEFRAVVFDYGGTLTEPYRDAMIAFYAQRPHLDLNLLREVLEPLAGGGEDSLLLRCERGEVDLDALVAHLDELHPGAGDVFRPEHTPLVGLTLNPDMTRLHEDVRAAGLKTAVLSNIFRGLETLYQLDHQHWDAIVFSSGVGMRKPQPEIYRYVCELLEVQPSEALFLDDFPEMCEGARAVGMTAVRVKDHVAAVAEARSLLGL